ncbi:MAG: hypothetical protein M3519_05385 [Actinomycetota bacterium]|nr:hypothetical protein [Actinomycetota bacterium]
MRELYQELTTASRQQAVLRAVILGSILAFTLVLLIAGESSTWAMVILTLLGVATAVNPHTGLPSFVLLILLATWAVGVDSLWTPWSLVAAVCMLVLHTACAVAAVTPAAAPVPREALARYAVRLGAVAAGTAVLWLMAGAQQLGGVPGGVVASITALLVLALGLGLHYVRITRTSEREALGPGFPGRRPDS